MGTAHLAGPLAVAILALVLFKPIYNVFFHPLRRIPGPKLYAMSRIPYARHHLRGTNVALLKRLHDQYGEAVRHSPDEVSFISIDTAVQDIYGFRTGKHKGHANTQKDMSWYTPPVNGAPGMIIANDQDHARARRVISHAFSDKALSSQEDILHQYIDQMIDGVTKTSRAHDSVNMTEWWQWTTFDVISDLTFGVPFGCLGDQSTHKFVDLVVQNAHGGRYRYINVHYPWIQRLNFLLKDRIINESQLATRVEFANWAAKQVDERIDRGAERPDFMEHILKHNGTDKGLSRDELHTNAITLLGAGTETTSTLLAAAVYLLCQNPDAYKKLQDEIRSEFTDYDDINLHAVSNLPYLNAIIHETFRRYAPIGAGFPRRITQPGGEMVSGYHIPEGISVSVSQDASFMSSRNWTEPEKFAPERWLGDEKYASDKREWMQPFSYGPRNCIGKNLAYAESRLFLSKFVHRFDFSLDERSANWIEDSLYMFIRVKPELYVHVKEAGKV